MRKAIILVVVAGLFFWAVYDFVIQSNQEAEADVGTNVDDQAPDFELTTLTGKTEKLSDYRGEPVMINFWASWCGPCRSEMPAMQNMYEQNDINILAVNLTTQETKRQDIPDFVDEFQLTFPVLLDVEGKTGSAYQIGSIPTSYFVNSDGIISYKHTGPLNEEQIMQQFEKMK
ncbi:TlpA family protein disulfide reductase [Virgibacillus sp. MSP4-1]|uniref:TlpA family protein disulfide reductase n=1 Tax=Virgibacillus sp. MSP4-1 TaxID=2700081 RepID=UPI0003A7B7AE|nr:TlpA disulfide reductase family protein [Virgibacillus sp. MSP4-1]QHS24257.1 TlpA family protein disulfide reductase [Virgibacillus sp. MSP4-1]